MSDRVRRWKPALLPALALLCLGVATRDLAQQPPVGEEKKSDDKKIEEKKDAAKPKAESREYTLTVVLVDASDETPVEQAKVTVFYGAENRTKPAEGGRVSFSFTTDARDVTVRVDAPGRVFYNSAVHLKDPKIEHRAALKKSD